MFRNPKAYQRFLLLVTVVILLFIAASAVGQPPRILPPSPTLAAQIAVSPTLDKRQQAAYLTAQGHDQLNRGDPAAALHTWDQALQLYQHSHYPEGITGSQINRSLALLALGHDRQACTTALTAIRRDRLTEFCRLRDYKNNLTATEQTILKQSLATIASSPLTALGLRVAGESLRKLGEIEVAKYLTEQGLTIAESLQLVPEMAKGYLNLANIESLFYRNNREIAERRDNKLDTDRQKVLNSAQRVLEVYHKATQLSDRHPEILELQGIQDILRVNQLSFLIEYEQWLNANQAYLIQGQTSQSQRWQAIKGDIANTIATLLNTSDRFSQVPTIAQFYADLSLADSLSQIPEPDQDFAPTALQLTTEALTLAKNLDNHRLQAIALGKLGHLHQKMGNLSQAVSHTEQALFLAQALKADELTFQQKHQLGQLYQQLGRQADAIKTYEAAIVDLDHIRKEILYNSSDLLFSFRSKVEPIYRELMALYLTENLEKAAQPDPTTLKKIININRQLQQVELENFLKCGLDVGEQKLILEDAVTKSADTIIYLIKLEGIQKLLTIVNNSQRPLQAHITAWDEIEPSISAIYDYLTASSMRSEYFDRQRFRQARTHLYNALIAPIKADLPRSSNLIFVIDTDLQGIPIALLQDEHDRYLIEDYPITYVPGSYIRPLRPLNLKQQRTLLSGVVDGDAFIAEDLPALTFVEPEIRDIQTLVKSTTVLLNQDFTANTLKERVYQAPIAILHLATHGRFSSNPAETKIWTYDQPLSLNDLDRLLRARTQTNPVDLELLVLSACETAKGDRRSGLGLAGVAIRAGARSTVASLWNVNDESTARFMTEFYRSLSRHKTRAESLRDAQLALLHHPQYSNPYYWAAFILVGSWT